MFSKIFGRAPKQETVINMELQEVKERLGQKMLILNQSLVPDRRYPNIEAVVKAVENGVVPSPSRRDVLFNMLAGFISGASLGISADILIKAPEIPAYRDLEYTGPASFVGTLCLLLLNPVNGKLNEEEFVDLLRSRLQDNRVNIGEVVEELKAAAQFLEELYSDVQNFKKLSH